MNHLKAQHLAHFEKQKDLKKIRSTAGPSAVAVEPAAAALPTLGRLIKTVLDYLKQEPHSQKSFEEIFEKTKVNVAANPGLLKELKVNPYVEYQETGSLAYRPRHALKNKGELLDKISSTLEGISAEELKDAYKEVVEDIKSLVDSRKVLQVINQDTKQMILYPNDTRFSMSVLPEFQSLWSAVKIPDAIDLEKEMERSNLPMMKQEKGLKRPASKQKKSNKQRKFKITNDHYIDGNIDLTKDFVVPPKHNAGQ